MADWKDCALPTLPTTTANASCKPRCKEPAIFSEKTEDLKERMFTLQEAIAILQLQITVGYAASFMEGSAAQWVMAYGRTMDAVPLGNSFRSSFVIHSRSNIRKSMNDNALLEQDKLVVWKIISTASAADVLQQGVWMT